VKLINRIAGAALAGFAILSVLAPSALAQAGGAGQDKAVPLSSVVRLNRAPVSKEILKVKLPQASEHKLANGMTVLILEQHKLPTIALELDMEPGAIADPSPGMAKFTAEMLREGTAKRSSSAIAGAVDEIGAQLSNEAEFGGSDSTIYIAGLTDSTETLFDLLSDIVLHPSFPAEELEKYKKRELGDLEDQMSRPYFLANKEFHTALYGATNYAVTAPTAAQIQDVTSQMLAEYHHKYYVPGSAVLGIVGDVNTAEVMKLVEKYFGEWPKTAPPEVKLAEVPPAQPKKVVLVDRPGSVQTNIVAGNLAIRRNDPDYFALTVMDRVVGGGPSARLFLNLREVHGYTYGAYSALDTDVYRGYWNANTEVRTAVTDGSLHELFNEFNRIRTEPVPPAELDEAKRALVASFALSLEDQLQLLGDALEVHHFGLPADYWDKYPEHIAGIDAAAVLAVGKKYVDVDHMQIICVGDAKQIKDTVAKYGPVTEVAAPATEEK
jgi:zinc protease